MVKSTDKNFFGDDGEKGSLGIFKFCLAEKKNCYGYEKFEEEGGCKYNGKTSACDAGCTSSPNKNGDDVPFCNHRRTTAAFGIFLLFALVGCLVLVMMWGFNTDTVCCNIRIPPLITGCYILSIFSSLLMMSLWVDWKLKWEKEAEDVDGLDKDVWEYGCVLRLNRPCVRD